MAASVRPYTGGVSEITPELVRHLGVLARIQLDDAEVRKITNCINDIKTTNNTIWRLVRDYSYPH